MVGKHYVKSLALLYLLGRVTFCVLLSGIFMALGIDKASADNPKDTIVFVNGDRLSGKLIQATNESVKFLGDVTKVVILQWSDIQGIDLGTNTLCVVGKANAANGSPNNFKLDRARIRVERRYLVLSSGTDTHKIAIDELISAFPKAARDNQALPHQSLFRGWRGQLQSQDSLTSSTQHQYQVGATVHMARATQSDEAFAYRITNVNLQANYGESKKPHASPVITQVYEGGLQEDVYITDNYDDFGIRRYGGARIVGVTDFYHNLSLGLNLEQAYGAGLAWDHQSGREGYGRQKYGVSVDLRYIGENLYSPGKAQKLVATSLGQNYQVKFSLVKGKPIILAESGSVIPAFNNSHALQARGIASLTVPLTPKFSIGVQEIDDYLRNAPPTSKQNYSSLQVKFTYTIGPATQQ